jgi:dipeptidyl aminopeptidase/acylaminoacyl peptidase
MTRRFRLLLAVCALIAVGLWVGIPAGRAVQLLRTSSSGSPRPLSGLKVQTISFRASDGVVLSGWFSMRSARAPTVVLIPGYRATRESMAQYARFLRPAGFNVLLYDPRGTGASSGSFSLGLREWRDVAGAVVYLQSRGDLSNYHFGLLGVSLGAGVAIVAAARLSAVVATVADSAPINQSSVVDRLDTLHLGPLSVPLAPIGPWTVDHLLGSSLSGFSPIASVRCIAPRGLLIIHSLHDSNPTTPPSDATTLKHAAGKQAMLWIAPRGDHAEALSAQPGEYIRRVTSFFRRYLVSAGFSFPPIRPSC